MKKPYMLWEGMCAWLELRSWLWILWALPQGNTERQVDSVSSKNSTSLAKSASDLVWMMPVVMRTDTSYLKSMTYSHSESKPRHVAAPGEPSGCLWNLLTSTDDRWLVSEKETMECNCSVLHRFTLSFWLRSSRLITLCDYWTISDSISTATFCGL